MEGGFAYDSLMSDEERKYRVLSENMEIPNDKSYAFLGAGGRIYPSKFIFIEASGGATVRKETHIVNPYFLLSIGLYHYDRQVKNLEISIGALWHDIGHGKVEFNEFGSASFDKEKQKWNFIVRIKWFFQDQLNKDKK